MPLSHFTLYPYGVTSMNRTIINSFATLLLLCAGGCTRFDVLNALSPQCGISASTGIVYGSLPRQKLDIYTPDKPSTKPLTVVIFLYGGEWSAGQRYNYRFAGKALASKGFCAVVPDYRLFPQVTFPKFVDDAALATRWVHDNIANYGGNPSELFLMGHSAGAHIGALLSLDPAYLAAVGLKQGDLRGFVGMSGPYNFIPYPEDRQTFNMRPGQIYPNPAIEPIRFARQPADVLHAPPMLLIQGLEDTTVKPRNAIELARAVNESGGHATVKYFAHQGHEAIVISMATFFRWLAPVLNDATDFIRDQAAMNSANGTNQPRRVDGWIVSNKSATVPMRP